MLRPVNIPIAGRTVTLPLILLIIIAIAIQVGSCGMCMIATATLPDPTPTPTLTATTTSTLRPTVTPPTHQTATPTPTPTATSPVTSSTSAPQASDTSAGNCVPSAAFRADVTIPDGTGMAPGAAFEKTWRVANTTDCAWPHNTDLVFQSGTQMDVPTRNPIGAILANSTIDITLHMRAPSTVGTHRTAWRLCAAADCFGPVLYAVINVYDPNAPVAQPTAASATIAPPPTVAPTPAPACECTADLYNCSSFIGHYDAQRCYEHCLAQGAGDIHRLDGDSDGSACENN